MVTDDVVAWRWCEAGLLPYRREPLVHERAWIHRGAWLDGEPADLPEDPYAIRRVGVDADGRVVIVGPAGIAVQDWTPEAVVRVRWDGEASEVVVADELRIAYACDDAGRPVSALSDAGEERYRYDDAGRVVGIEEAPALFEQFATWAHESREAGGALRVEHDDRGPRRIVDEAGREVWVAPTEPFDAWLADRAARVADVIRAAVDAAVREEGEVPVESYGVCLTYVEQGPLGGETVSVGRQETRPDGWEAAYFIQDGGGLEEIEPDSAAWDEVFEGADPLQRAALAVGGDPYRTILAAVCRELAVDPPASLRPTADFVVLFAEHDEGVAEKVDAIRAVNPPARAEAFVAALLEGEEEEEAALPPWWSREPEQTTWGRDDWP